MCLRLTGLQHQIQHWTLHTYSWEGMVLEGAQTSVVLKPLEKMMGNVLSFSEKKRMRTQSLAHTQLQFTILRFHLPSPAVYCCLLNHYCVCHCVSVDSPCTPLPKNNNVFGAEEWGLHLLFIPFCPANRYQQYTSSKDEQGLHRQALSNDR